MQKMGDSSAYNEYEAFCWVSDIADALSYMHNHSAQVGAGAVAGAPSNLRGPCS